MPDFWKENQGAAPYDELAARRIANTIKLRLAGISTVTSTVATDGAVAPLLAAYLAAAATTEKPGDFAEGKKRTGQ
jgi:hypothetical protein